MNTLDVMQNFISAQTAKKTEDDVIQVGSSDALGKFYEKVKSRYNFDELKDILDCEDNMLIESGAGSGKTTTLLLKILRDILSGRLLATVYVNGKEMLIQRKIWVSTFLKSGAEDIRQTFENMIKDFNIRGINNSCIKFSTIHSEVYSALRDMGMKLNVITEEDSRKFLRAACDTYKIKSVNSKSNSRTLTNEELSDIASIITYARNRLDNTRFDHPLMQEYNISELELKGIMDRFNLLKKADYKQDFEDLEEQLYEGYQINPKVVEFIQSRYDYIYVDEFQDTSQLQYALLKPYLQAAKGFIMIGDADQCFTGDSLVQTEKGATKISDVKVGDKVLTAIGNGELEYREVNKVVKKVQNTGIVKIKTKSGNALHGTADHLVFVKESCSTHMNDSVELVVFGSTMKSSKGNYGNVLSVYTHDDELLDVVENYISRGKEDYPECVGTFYNVDNSLTVLRNLVLDCTEKKKVLKPIVYTKLSNDRYSLKAMSELKVNDVLAYVKDGVIIDDVVVEVNRLEYNDFVYDLSIPDTRNYVVNGLIVHNCIYSFRGSDISLIQEKIEQDFTLSVKQLTVNRRCGEPILSPIVPSIEKNSKRRAKHLYSTKKEGEVIVVVDNAVNYLRKSIKEDLDRGEKVGIVGRTNDDLLIPAVLLLIEGYNSFSVSRSISLTERMPKQVLGAMTLITKRYTNDFESIWKLFLTKYESWQATKLCETLATTPSYSIYNMDIEDLKYSLPTLFPIIQMLRKKREKFEETQDDKYLKDAYLELLRIMERNVYNGKTIYAQRARDFVYYIRRIIEDHPMVKGKTLEEIQKMFLEDFVQELDKRRPQKSHREKVGDKWMTIAAQKDNASIKITTVHDAKGKQWDNVYIWNDVEGCFPNVVGNRPLTDDEFEEERRIHYIAWTRPTKKLVVFTRSDRPIGFLKECDLSNAKVINNSGRALNADLAMAVRKKEDKANDKTTDDSGYYQITEQDVKDYIKKYCSYEYLCTKNGEVLDFCLQKFNGSPKLISYLTKMTDKQIRSYINDKDTKIEDVIGFILLDVYIQAQMFD